MNQMLKFSSKIFDEIVIEGLINLKVKRNFKWFRTFDLKIFDEDNHLLTIATITDFLKIKLIPNKKAVAIKTRKNKISSEA